MTEAQWVGVALAVITALFSVIGWLLKDKNAALTHDLAALATRITEQAAELSAHRLEVAKGCVMKDDFKEGLVQIFKRLDEITNLLHTKADRT